MYCNARKVASWTLNLKLANLQLAKKTQRRTDHDQYTTQGWFTTKAWSIPGMASRGQLLPPTSTLHQRFCFVFYRSRWKHHAKHVEREIGNLLDVGRQRQHFGAQNVSLGLQRLIFRTQTSTVVGGWKSIHTRNSNHIGGPTPPHIPNQQQNEHMNFLRQLP